MATKLVRDMTPSELCAWLKDQNIDEGCCKLLTETHKIKGTTFLCLTKEILNTDLGIEALGDRLDILQLVTKAQQQQEKQHEKRDEAVPIALCYSYKMPDTEEASTSQPSDAAGAYIISRDKLWPKGKKSLKVCFMDEVPDTWKYGAFNDRITKREILELAKVWNNLPASIDGREYIPKLVAAQSMQEADIRVRFGSGANWSMIGTDATQVISKQPTMTLSLGHPDDNYKQHLVRHEFGHALGLGHEHQSPNAPALIAKDALIPKLATHMPGESPAAKRKAAAAKYEQDYGQHSVVADDAVITEHDPESIMHYWIPSEWLKDPAKHPNGIGLPLPTVPSDTDLRTLATSYKQRVLCPEDVLSPKKVSAGGQASGGSIVSDYSSVKTDPVPVSISTIPPPNTSGTLVRKEVLTRLQNLLDPIVANWSLFAQQIGVPYTKITQIQTVNARIGPTWISTCLQQALEWWVENGRSPTYEAIIATLDPPGDEMTPVMNRRLAGRVREFMARERAGPPGVPVEPGNTAAVQQRNGGIDGHYGDGGIRSSGLQYHSLNTSDYSAVTTYLVGVNNSIIRSLGIVLGIAPWRMQRTNADEMVSLWFQKLDGVDEKCQATGGLTWESLESAMRHPTVGLNGTANDIKRQKLGL